MHGVLCEFVNYGSKPRLDQTSICRNVIKDNIVQSALSIERRCFWRFEMPFLGREQDAIVLPGLSAKELQDHDHPTRSVLHFGNSSQLCGRVTHGELRREAVGLGVWNYVEATHKKRESAAGRLREAHAIL